MTRKPNTTIGRLIFSLALTLALVPVRFAAAQGAQATPDANPDAIFFTKATQAGMAEVNAGNLAATHGKSPAVRSAGVMLVQDHTRTNDALRALADIKHVTLPPPDSATPGPRMTMVQSLTGDAFDRAFVGWQIVAHKEAIVLFNEEAASGEDPDVRRLAMMTVPTLQAHLKMLEAITLPLPPSEPPPPRQ